MHRFQGPGRPGVVRGRPRAVRARGLKPVRSVRPLLSKLDPHVPVPIGDPYKKVGHKV